MTLAKQLKAVLIDLSGTLHIEDQITPLAVDALCRLRSTGLTVRFLTNTTKESKSFLYDRLRRCGFALDKEEIFTSLSAARQLIDSRRLNPFLLVDEKALEDFEGVTKEGPIDAVVVGLAPAKFHYDLLNEAFRHLNSGADLIAIHKARYYSRGDGLALGPGAFVAGLEFATGKPATIVGKPEPAFFRAALQGIDCTVDQVLMIGDDIRDDVEGALSAGLHAILVRTGKYRPGDEQLSKLAPTAVCDHFAQAVDFITGVNVS